MGQIIFFSRNKSREIMEENTADSAKIVDAEFHEIKPPIDNKSE